MQLKGLDFFRAPRRIAHVSGLAAGRARLRHAFCSLFGSKMLLHLEYERVSLRCVNCGYETPGWTLAATRHDPVGHRDDVFNVVDQRREEVQLDSPGR
jgi:hypothetical protein